MTTLLYIEFLRAAKAQPKCGGAALPNLLSCLIALFLISSCLIALVSAISRACVHENDDYCYFVAVLLTADPTTTVTRECGSRTKGAGATVWARRSMLTGKSPQLLRCETFFWRRGGGEAHGRKKGSASWVDMWIYWPKSLKSMGRLQ